MTWTLEEAREHLAMWLRADLKLATGEEYWVGNRKLVRADAESVKERIAFWRGEVAKLEAIEQGNRGLRRSWRVVPRDI